MSLCDLACNKDIRVVRSLLIKQKDKWSSPTMSPWFITKKMYKRYQLILHVITQYSIWYDICTFHVFRWVHKYSCQPSLIRVNHLRVSKLCYMKDIFGKNQHVRTLPDMANIYSYLSIFQYSCNQYWNWTNVKRHYKEYAQLGCEEHLSADFIQLEETPKMDIVRWKSSTNI